jgi:hypothetical protein
MTVATGLPPAVIKEDRALEERASSSAADLCKLRWHWTMDESNPGRVSMREYARQVGKAERSISTDARAYGIFSDTGARITINDARERAAMSVETLAAAEVVAKHHGVKLGQARKEHRRTIARIRDTAREVAEDKGTSTVDEIPGAAEFLWEESEAEQERDERRKRNTPTRLLEAEEAWSKSYDYLLKGARAVERVEFDAEERELLRGTLDNIKRLLVILDRALSDRQDRSWISDLKVIEGGRAS